MKLKYVINFFGGPGTGKSVAASELFVTMKKKGMNVELITEYAKDLTWEARYNILEQDQLYIFAKQHRKLLRIKDHVEYAITDSPLLLSSIYFNQDTSLYPKQEFINLVNETFNQYPNINVLLIRNKNFKYQQIGRNQNSYEAEKIDEKMVHYLDSYYPDNFFPLISTDVQLKLLNLLGI